MISFIVAFYTYTATLVDEYDFTISVTTTLVQDEVEFG